MDLAGLNYDEILPHRRRMRLVEVLEEVRDGEAITRIPVREDSAFLTREGAFKPSWIVELVAQSVACYFGWYFTTLPERPGDYGYVVAVEGLEADPLARPVAGDTLRVSVRRDFEMPPAGIFSGEVLWNGRVIGKATVKTLVETAQGLMGERSDGAQAGIGHRG